MKYRQGFVSNSSTCSFVVIGFVFDRKEIKSEDVLKAIDYEKWMLTVGSKEYKEYIENGDADFLFREELDNLDFCIADNEEDGAPEGKILIGHDYKGNEWMTGIYDLGDILDSLKSLKEKLKDTIPENADISLVTGTRMC